MTRNLEGMWCIDWAFTLATSAEEIFSNLDVKTGHLIKNPPVPSGSGKLIVCLHWVLVQGIRPWHKWFFQSSWHWWIVSGSSFGSGCSYYSYWGILRTCVQSCGNWNTILSSYDQSSVWLRVCQYPSCSDLGYIWAWVHIGGLGSVFCVVFLLFLVLSSTGYQIGRHGNTSCQSWWG